MSLRGKRPTESIHGGIDRSVLAFQEVGNLEVSVGGVDN